jgi:hypothetical protein
MLQRITIVAGLAVLSFASPAISQDTRPVDQDTRAGTGLHDADDRGKPHVNDRDNDRVARRVRPNDHDLDDAHKHAAHRRCRVEWRHHHRVRRCWVPNL